jgi:hypothetical protein
MAILNDFTIMSRMPGIQRIRDDSIDIQCLMLSSTFF